MQTIGEESIAQVTVQDLRDATGWGEYIDTTYTSGSPFQIVADTKVTLPNNAGTTRETEKPSDVTTFYDSANSKITGRAGDGLAFTIEFTCVPTTA